MVPRAEAIGIPTSGIVSRIFGRISKEITRWRYGGLSVLELKKTARCSDTFHQFGVKTRETEETGPGVRGVPTPV